MSKFLDKEGQMRVGEVRYFHITRRSHLPVAMVSVFGSRDERLYASSFKTVELMEYAGDQALEVIDAKRIQAVVGMIPDIVITSDEYRNDHIHLHRERKYFVVEKLGYAVEMGSWDPEMDIDE